MQHVVTALRALATLHSASLSALVQHRDVGENHEEHEWSDDPDPKHQLLSIPKP